MYVARVFSRTSPVRSAGLLLYPRSASSRACRFGHERIFFDRLQEDRRARDERNGYGHLRDHQDRGRPQPPCAPPAAPADFIVAMRSRHANEPRPAHADNRERDAVDPDRFSQRRVAAEGTHLKKLLPKRR